MCACTLSFYNLFISIYIRFLLSCWISLSLSLSLTFLRSLSLSLSLSIYLYRILFIFICLSQSLLFLFHNLTLYLLLSTCVCVCVCVCVCAYIVFPLSIHLYIRISHFIIYLFIYLSDSLYYLSIYLSIIEKILYPLSLRKSTPDVALDKTNGVEFESGVSDELRWRDFVVPGWFYYSICCGPQHLPSYICETNKRMLHFFFLFFVVVKS